MWSIIESEEDYIIIVNLLKHQFCIAQSRYFSNLFLLCIPLITILVCLIILCKNLLLDFFLVLKKLNIIIQQGSNVYVSFHV